MTTLKQKPCRFSTGNDFNKTKICALTQNSCNNGTECNGEEEDKKNCPFWQRLENR